MSLNRYDLITLADIAIDAATQAGKMIGSKAGQAVAYEKKSTGASLASQVVTEVDHMSQVMVLKYIEPTCQKYDVGLLAEESEDDGSRFEKDYFWSIDPMDGTLPFIESRPGYAVSIGLVSKHGVPHIGVVYDPLNHILYYAIRGVGVFRNKQIWSADLTPYQNADTFDRGGAVMNACWVLENPPTYFYKNPKKTNGGGCVWDYAATACIFEVMGAWVSDMYGQPLELNRKELPYMNHKGILFATNKSVAEKIFL